MENRLNKNTLILTKTKLKRNVKRTLTTTPGITCCSLLLNILVDCPDGAHQYDNFVFNISKQNIGKSQNS